MLGHGCPHPMNPYASQLEWRDAESRYPRYGRRWHSIATDGTQPKGIFCLHRTTGAGVSSVGSCCQGAPLLSFNLTRQMGLTPGGYHRLAIESQAKESSTWEACSVDRTLRLEALGDDKVALEY